MVRSKGIKLFSWLARRSLSNDPLYESLTRGGFRKFDSSIYGHFNISNSHNHRYVNWRYWSDRGTTNAYHVNTRSIHATSHMASKDYYDTLGLNKNATASEIEKAYHALAKKWNPDANKDDPEAEIRFQEISNVYEVLKDEEKRAQYDQFVKATFWRYQHCGNIGRLDVKVYLELSYIEAVKGCTRNVVFETELPCKTCGASGRSDVPLTKPETCRKCKGTGTTTFKNGRYRIQRKCTQHVKGFCKSCNGKRVVGGLKSLKLNILPGVDTKEVFWMSRSGRADPEGKQPGDLYVVIKVQEDPTTQIFLKTKTMTVV